MGPNPTSFQLYLEQDVDNHSTYNHWGHEGASIRGYKMYWHQPLAKAKAMDSLQKRKKRLKVLVKSVQLILVVTFYKSYPFRIV